MYIYDITNGYMGNSIVSCVLCANSDTEAFERAKKYFKKSSIDEFGKDIEGYYNHLQIRAKTGIDSCIMFD